MITTLSLQEAKASSEIENIVTTREKLFKSALDPLASVAGPAKEVALYSVAMRLGWDQLQQTGELITYGALIKQYQLLKRRRDGFRESAGTALLGSNSNIVYVPPQNPDNVKKHMSALERFINDDQACPLDPLIKMAIIHHQFESIHPFSDGNGRIGRMLNVLYLCRTGLLNLPILHLSRGINARKSEYYQLLQAPRDAQNTEALQAAWQTWVIFMLETVAETASMTVTLVREIREQMAAMKHLLRDGDLANKKIYSQDLLNNLFQHPYTRVEYVQRDLSVTRPTATKYLDTLAASGVLDKIKIGRNNYYVNRALMTLLTSIGGE